MKFPVRWLALSLLGVVLVGSATQIIREGESESASSSALYAPTGERTDIDTTTLPRVEVDRPKPTYLLSERDPRIHHLQPFQALVDAAPAGFLLKPPPGHYAGPVTLSKPLTIEGGGQVTIDAGDKGTVFLAQTNDVTLRGLHLTGSGDSHDTDDACLDVRGHRARIENMTIDNCLIGIDLKQSTLSVVRNNRIRSKPVSLGMRGDGIRLWYSHHNKIENNDVSYVRDMVAWYSHDNLYRNNLGQHSRYSIHFMFSNRNKVENNRFINNTVGIYFMYSEACVARNNYISHATGVAGMGIGFKEASDILIENNEIIYSAAGVVSDLSPFQPNTTIRFNRNRFAYNGIGLMFTSDLGNNHVTDNTFEGNLTHVAYGGRRGESVTWNLWKGNYWDNYQGFDRDSDGVGDRPYEMLAFSDMIWMEMPPARFFANSPVMELLDFLERLAPFSTPELILKDEAPRYSKPMRKS